MKREADIKAPDGFLLGGLRRVHKDGTILFQRGYWKVPDPDWIGQDVWVHCEDSGAGDLEVAPPGVHIYTAQSDKITVWCERTERPDAKSGRRTAAHKAWTERGRS